MTTTPTEALAAWDALDDERAAVQVKKQLADEGHGSYDYADSAGFDLNEKEADVGGDLAQALRVMLVEHKTAVEVLAGVVEDLIDGGDGIDRNTLIARLGHVESILGGDA